MPDDSTNTSEKGGMFGGLKGKLKNIPTWMYIAGAGVGLFVVYNFRKSGTTGTTATNSNGVDQGSMGGLPYYFDSGQGSSGIDGNPYPYGGDSIPPIGPALPPNPTPNPTAPNPSTTPLIPLGQWPKNIPDKFGQTLTYNGTTWTIGPGSNGNIWGVPGTGMSFQQWQNTPIQPGGKQLLYGPASAYQNSNTGSGGASGFDALWNDQRGHNDASAWAHMVS